MTDQEQIAPADTDGGFIATATSTVQIHQPSTESRTR